MKKKKFRTFKRSVLSMALSLSLVISSFAGTGIEVSAEEAPLANGGGVITIRRILAG